MGGGGRLGGGKTRRGAAEAIPKTGAGARAGAAPLCGFRRGLSLVKRTAAERCLQSVS